jgi:tRNA nucleotidyltransferase (CCA-adding enzyme)
MTPSSPTLIAALKDLFPLPCHDRIFLVGGALRDILLRRDSKDIDLVGALSPDELGSSGFRLVKGKSTSPIWLRHLPELGKVEVTPIEDTDGLISDLGGRDFTVNAIALDMRGEIIDPLNGRYDLERHLLRVCSSDSFSNDPLRIFRALRFEADGWRMTTDTEALIHSFDWAELLLNIPVERFSREMLKVLEYSEPERFFQRMLELNVGKVFLPELFRMPSIPAGPLIHHPEGDLFTHSCQVLQRVSMKSTEPLARFCALFHDIGKLATDPAHYPKHHGHDQAGFVSAADFCDRLRLPAVYRTALAWTSRLHGKLNLWNELRDATKIRIAGEAVKAGIEEILPLVSAADKVGSAEHVGWWDAVRISGMTTSEMGIDPARLEEISIGKRGDYILQKRVEMLRGRT